MNQEVHNINKDMFDSDDELIDIEILDFSDEQTWLCKVPDDSGQKVDIVDWNLSCDWVIDDEFLKNDNEINNLVDGILNNEFSTPANYISNELSTPDKHKFDSRTYIKPKKRVQRPSIHSIVEAPSNLSSLLTIPTQSTNRYLTYNKYSMPLGPISPMLRLKTFNVDTNSENSHVVKDFAMKRRSIAQDEDPQLEDQEVNPAQRLSDYVPSTPISIDLSQPSHYVHNSFNRGISDRFSTNMYRSGESISRMSPPSLVSSIVMDNSDYFTETDGKKSTSFQKDLGVRRDNPDPMLTSMTLSILDEKDMNTSFLSQTTQQDHDSLLDSLPPSLINSVNSSIVTSNTSKPKDSLDHNVFSSPTYTHLEQSEKLLTARPRCQLYNNFTRRDSGTRRSESYTKSREEGCQIDTGKVLSENMANETLKTATNMSETITLHFSNNRFKNSNVAEKENLNGSFEKDDDFYKDMGMKRTADHAKNSLNVTLDKQELNEIIQARQKLSLARKALPNEPDKIITKVDVAPTKVFSNNVNNQTTNVPKQNKTTSEIKWNNSNDAINSPDEPVRESPKRNATFKKSSKATAMDTTMVYVKNDEEMIDINSATLCLIDPSETVSRTLRHEDWGTQDRAMVGSSESTDTGTFSSSSPPESVPDALVGLPPESRKTMSTPLMAFRRTAKDDLLSLQNTISPIFDSLDDTVAKVPSSNSDDPLTAENSGVFTSRPSAKRDILAPRTIIDRKTLGPSATKMSSVNPANYPSVAGPTNVTRKTGLPTSKYRQYSSHKELNRIPGNVHPLIAARPSVGRVMTRRNVYASNPVLSPTAPTPPAPMAAPLAPPLRHDSYVIVDKQLEQEEKPQPVLIRQGTETLRRERPQSQLVAPKDPPTTRPYSIAGVSQLRVSRPSSVPVQKPAPVTVTSTMEAQRPSSVQAESKASGLPRPSRLPAPRRTLRPPSVYSVVQSADIDHY